MKKSVVRALASGDAAFKCSGPLSLRRLHSEVGATRHNRLRNVRSPLPAALRAPASKASTWVFSPSASAPTDSRSTAQATRMQA